MSFCALTLAAVRDELEPRLINSRLQRLIFVDELSLAAEFFVPGAGRTNVLVSADQEHGRVQRIQELPARGLERDTPFSLAARKHLRNARIQSLRQPPLERLLELDCEQRDASGRHYRVLLIVEAMGRRSNLVLVGEDGTIIDAARRTPPSRNPRRPVLPHLPYVPPPAQSRLLPEELSPDASEREAEVAMAAVAQGASSARSGSLSLAKFLANRVAGLSPVAAREIAFRATGAIDAPILNVSWSTVVENINALLGLVDSHAWQPTVAFDGDAAIEYAAFELRHLADNGGRLEPFATISDAMSTYYAALKVTATRRGDPLAAERKALLAPLERAVRTTERRIAALAHQLETAQNERDALRQAGEAILAHQTEGIELDPNLSAVENAQAYFARYRKAREAEERVPALLTEARHTLEYLRQLSALVEIADGMDTVRALRREVGQAAGSATSRETRSQSNRQAKSAPYRRIALDGFEALIGTSAAGNAAVTFDLARPDDLWLHARGVPGAHVILRGDPSDQVVERAAQLAAQHSSARDAAAVEVDVTRQRYVKKVPGAQPGLVRYSNERTLRVSPRNT